MYNYTKKLFWRREPSTKKKPQRGTEGIAQLVIQRMFLRQCQLLQRIYHNYTIALCALSVWVMLKWNSCIQGTSTCVQVWVSDGTMLVHNAHTHVHKHTHAHKHTHPPTHNTHPNVAKLTTSRHVPSSPAHVQPIHKLTFCPVCRCKGIQLAH